MTTMRIAPRFRGPAKSGNGGYVAGLVGTALAALSPADMVPRVRLLAPPPMETDLELSVDPAGAKLAGSTPVAEGVPVSTDTLADAMVDPVGPDEAMAAEAKYRGLVDHPFPGCFVCGPENREGLQLKPGPVGDGRTACTWHPATDLAASDRLVDPVYLWSALDCPGGWAIDLEGRPSVLGQMTACIDARPRPGEPCVVMGRVLGEDGRKTHTASTLYDSDGRVLARARHTWILVDPALFN
jgi:acyl-coenzyme A thioesterase PaaI-like protein